MPRIAAVEILAQRVRDSVSDPAPKRIADIDVLAGYAERHGVAPTA
jgi:hypothetical protein